MLSNNNIRYLSTSNLIENMRRNTFFKDLILSILLISNEISIGNVIGGSRLCWKVVDGTNISNCCFNHYLLDNHCHECEFGTTSTDGLTCLPCAANQYGDKCKHRCNCGIYERCDPEFGCLELTETSSKLEMSSNRQPEHDTLLATIATENMTNDDDARTAMLYIILVSAGLIIWLIICWTCDKLFYKLKIIRQEGSRTSQITKA